MASKKPEGGGWGRGSSGNPTGGGGRAKSNVTKIGNKKTMGKTEAKVRVKTDRIKKSRAAEDMRKGNLDNLKKTFAKPKTASKPVSLTTRGKATAIAGTGVAIVGTTKGMKKAGEKNAERIRKNKSKSVPVPRDRKKQ
jgi:hypothetical protein